MIKRKEREVINNLVKEELTNDKYSILEKQIEDLKHKLNTHGNNPPTMTITKDITRKIDEQEIIKNPDILDNIFDELELNQSLKYFILRDDKRIAVLLSYKNYCLKEVLYG